MSTLKHKQFIQSRKRKLKLVASEEEKNGLLMLGVGDDNTIRTSEALSNGDDGLSPTQDKCMNCKSLFSKQPVSVRFSSTLDLIISPYLPDQTDAETLDRFHHDIWYTREDYRMFYQDRLETVRLWRSLRSMEPHQQQHHYQKLELRGLEQYQSGSVSAELNQQRAEHTAAVLRAAWERRQLLQQNEGNADTAAACENMIRHRAEPRSLLATERAQYLAAQDAKEALGASDDNNNCNQIDEEDEANNSRSFMEEGEQSPTKKSKRCVSPPESPQSILDMQLIDTCCISNNHAILNSNSYSITDEQQLNNRDRRLQNMKQRLLQESGDAPPTPMMRRRGTFSHNQGPPDMRMMMTDMVSAPSTPMKGRRTVASLPGAWNNTMGAPTPMHRRSKVCPFPTEDGNRSNVLPASSSAPSTPIMNGRHTISMHMKSGAAPLTPTMLRSQSSANRTMKYPPTHFHLTGRGTKAGLMNADFDNYMLSAQQHHDIRQRSSNDNSNNMSMMPRDNNGAVSHNDLLLRQDSLTIGMHPSHHGLHHQKQQHNVHNDYDYQRRQDASHHIHQHSSLLQQQQNSHMDMCQRALSISSSGFDNNMRARHQQYEAMRRGSLGGLNDCLSNLGFHNTSHSTDS